MAGYLRLSRMSLLALALGWTLTSCGSTTKNDTKDTTTAQSGTSGTTGETTTSTPSGATTQTPGMQTPGTEAPVVNTPATPAPVGAGSTTTGGLTASTTENLVTRYSSGEGKVCTFVTSEEASAILGFKVTQEKGNDDNCTLVPVKKTDKTLISISMVTNPDLFERMTRGGERLSGYGDSAMVKPPVMGILKGTKAVMISIANPAPGMDEAGILKKLGAKVSSRL